MNKPNFKPLDHVAIHAIGAGKKITLQASAMKPGVVVSLFFLGSQVGHAHLSAPEIRALAADLLERLDVSEQNL